MGLEQLYHPGAFFCFFLEVAIYLHVDMIHVCTVYTLYIYIYIMMHIYVCVLYTYDVYIYIYYILYIIDYILYCIYIYIYIFNID